jgi:hypothetical protein
MEVKENRVFRRIYRRKSLEAREGSRKMNNEECQNLYSPNSFVNRTIINWNQIPAELLETFPCSLSTFKQKVLKAATNK